MAGSSNAPKSWLVGDSGLMVSINAAGDIRTRAQLTDASLNGLTRVDEYTAWAVGDEGEILYTTDGGAHWVRQDVVTKAALYAVSFSNAQHGVAAGAAGTMLETDDGGAHWHLVGVESSAAETRAYRAVALSPTTGNGVAVGDAGLLSWTTDSGRTWTSNSAAGPTALTGVALNEDDVAIAVGRGGAAYRIDHEGVQPLHWAATSVRDLAAVRFLGDGDHLVAVGAQGTILEAQLSTSAVSVAASATQEDLYAVAVFSGDSSHRDGDLNERVMAVGANGALVLQAHSGAAFEAVPSHTTAVIRSLDGLSGE